MDVHKGYEGGTVWLCHRNLSLSDTLKMRRIAARLNRNSFIPTGAAVFDDHSSGAGPLAKGLLQSEMTEIDNSHPYTSPRHMPEGSRQKNSDTYVMESQDLKTMNHKPTPVSKPSRYQHSIRIL